MDLQPLTGDFFDRFIRLTLLKFDEGLVLEWGNDPSCHEHYNWMVQADLASRICLFERPPFYNFPLLDCKIVRISRKQLVGGGEHIWTSGTKNAFDI